MRRFLLCLSLALSACLLQGESIHNKPAQISGILKDVFSDPTNPQYLFLYLKGTNSTSYVAVNYANDEITPLLENSIGAEITASGWMSDNGKVIRVKGIVRRIPRADAPDDLLYIEDNGFLVAVNGTASTERLGDVQIDCTVEVTGVCVMNVDVWRPNAVFPVIHGYTLVTLTTFGSANGLSRALEAGADGALTKSIEDATLVTTIRKIAAGSKIISPEIRKMLAKNPPIPELSPRQKDILASITRGLTNKGIAAELGISARSVDEHVNTLFQKLGAANRAEAVAIALKKQLLKM